MKKHVHLTIKRWIRCKRCRKALVLWPYPHIERASFRPRFNDGEIVHLPGCALFRDAPFQRYGKCDCGAGRAFGARAGRRS